MTVTVEQQYRPINLEFLDRSGDERFDIFYKTSHFGDTQFVRFASTDPRHQDKVRRLLESGEVEEEFFIHVDDLFKYYKQATRTLRRTVANPRMPVQEKTKKIYAVSKGIMKEFFEYHASDKILHTSEEVMGLMDQCLASENFGFYGLTQLTSKDYYTYTHSVNVGLYCLTYGVKVKMSHADTRLLGLGGMLHDVGKAKVPSEILNKDGELTEDEFELIKDHSDLGAELLTSMQCYGNKVINMAAEHHENYKGGGYPRGLEGSEISLYGRICKIMDVYDALTTRRSYKKALSTFDALTLMKKEMYEEFDPGLFKNFIRFMGPDL